MAAPRIVQPGVGDVPVFDTTDIPVASATQIKVGWFVSLESNTAEAMDTVTEDATFAGIAGTAHEPSVDYRDTITLLEKCEVEVDVTSATYTRGEGLKLTSGSGDSIALVTDASANTIAWAAETKTSAVTRLRVRIDVWALQKLRGAVSA